MTLFFSYDKLSSLKSPKKILQAMHKLYMQHPLYTKYIGNSFLLNPSPLFIANISDRDKQVYVHYASLRNYSDYKILGFKGLDISLYPDIINYTELKNNPFITVKNNIASFKYEELNK
jgi:hypothetical protein